MKLKCSEKDECRLCENDYTLECPNYIPDLLSRVLNEACNANMLDRNIVFSTVLMSEIEEAREKLNAVQFSD